MARPAVLRRGLSGRQMGSVIGAVFGLVYVEANASGLGQPGSLVVRIVGASAFVACLLLLGRGLRRDPTRPAEPGRAEPRRFGLGYWRVVAGEAVVLFVGWYALSGPLGRPEAALPWVTLVVGVHFFALAFVFRARVQHALGGGVDRLWRGGHGFGAERCTGLKCRCGCGSRSRIRAAGLQLLGSHWFRAHGGDA